MTLINQQLLRKKKGTELDSKQKIRISFRLVTLINQLENHLRSMNNLALSTLPITTQDFNQWKFEN